MTRKTPEIIEVNFQQLEELLNRAASNTLREEDTELMRQIFGSYVQFFEIVGDKNTTIARLRKLLFGASTEKTETVVGDEKDAEEPNTTDSDNADSEHTDPHDSAGTDVESPPGHGRYGADDYPGAKQVDIRHPTLCVGDDCPDCHGGTLYEKRPSVFVRFVGQAPFQATVYRMQRLRCCLCGKVFTAPVPDGVGEEKYDHTVASMIGLLKYGSGLPFNRLQRLQGNCEIPLAASTQWGIVHAGSLVMAPAYEELIWQAAQGEVVYNDDTTVKILELMGRRAEQSPPPDDPHDPGRTGLFTSGVVATRAGLRIALFFSGRQHAGENLTDVLKHRATEFGTPIQMCDGLARNLPKDLETILSNCLAHYPEFGFIWSVLSNHDSSRGFLQRAEKIAPDNGAPDGVPRSLRYYAKESTHKGPSRYPRASRHAAMAGDRVGREVPRLLHAGGHLRNFWRSSTPSEGPNYLESASSYAFPNATQPSVWHFLSR